ncbi:hypothetical protein BVRB_4g095980 [Beta vulgaris subsp. vulgaris]|nr:hypothetical protein BVRB_4g095980 [Beta vulgaris subsp. vulgaris]
MNKIVVQAKDCDEFYPWITPTCDHSEVLDAPCKDECYKRHGVTALPFCKAVVDPPLLWCGCTYAC